jgi:hypothetical protein
MAGRYVWLRLRVVWKTQDMDFNFHALETKEVLGEWSVNDIT